MVEVESLAVLEGKIYCPRRVKGKTPEVERGYGGGTRHVSVVPKRYCAYLLVTLRTFAPLPLPLMFSHACSSHDFFILFQRRLVVP